jgi:hypothetical protein
MIFGLLVRMPMRKSAAAPRCALEDEEELIFETSSKNKNKA